MGKSSLPDQSFTTTVPWTFVVTMILGLMIPVSLQEPEVHAKVAFQKPVAHQFKASPPLIMVFHDYRLIAKAPRVPGNTTKHFFRSVMIPVSNGGMDTSPHGRPSQTMVESFNLAPSVGGKRPALLWQNTPLGLSAEASHRPREGVFIWEANPGSPKPSLETTVPPLIHKVMADSPPAGIHPEVILKDSLRHVRGKTAERLLHPIILQAANRYEIEPALVKAIIMAESGYNPMAVSKKGARGLMQLMPRTAKWLGVEDSFDPEHNIEAGVRYFRQLLNRFDGDVSLALAAYNAGSAYVRQYQGIPPFKATKFYIKKVFEYYQSYKRKPTTNA